MITKRFPVLVIFCCLILSGCASISENALKNIEFNLDSVSFKDPVRNLLETLVSVVEKNGGAENERMELRFGIMIKNHNGYELRIKSLVYEVEINGKKVGDGKSEWPDDFVLAGSGQSTMYLPIGFNSFEVAKQAINAFMGEPATVEIKGAAEVKTPVFGYLKVPFSAKRQKGNMSASTSVRIKETPF